MGDVRDVITCAKFKIEIFMGYDFTGGRIFDFPIDFSMGLTTVQRYCAACDSQLTLMSGVSSWPSATTKSVNLVYIVAVCRDKRKPTPAAAINLLHGPNC